MAVDLDDKALQFDRLPGFPKDARIRGHFANGMVERVAEISFARRRFLDEPESAVRQAATLEFTGWALDVDAGCPVSSMLAIVDDTIVVEAITGLESPEHVARNADIAGAGFRAFVFTDLLRPGRHEVRFVACDATASAWDLIGEPIVFYVEENMRAPRRIEPPFAGSIDFIGGFRTLQSGIHSIRRGRNVYVRGWAADVERKRPARYVMVFVDGKPRVTASCELVRPDVASAYANQRLATCGFVTRFPTADLPAGRYDLTICASTNGRSWHQVHETFTLRVTRFAIEELPRRTIHAPARIDDLYVEAESNTWTPVSLARVAAGRALRLRGWALDPETETPAGGVFLRVESGPVFEATYGIERADLAEHFSENYRFAGFEGLVPTERLIPGNYRLSVSVISHDLCEAYDTSAWTNFTVGDDVSEQS